MKSEVMEEQNASSSGLLQENGENHNGDEEVSNEYILQLFVDLQKHWMSELQYSREKVLVEMAERVSFIFLCRAII